MNSSYLFSIKAFLLVLGGLASLLLTVTIKTANRKRKISDAKATIENAIQMELLLKSKYGDTDTYLEADPETQSLIFLEGVFYKFNSTVIIIGNSFFVRFSKYRWRSFSFGSYYFFFWA